MPWFLSIVHFFWIEVLVFVLETNKRSMTMLNVQVSPHNPHIFTSLEMLREETAVSHKRLLLPFSDVAQLAQAMDSALQMASDASAELILLRVCHQQKPLAEREDIFSELKGIQARSQLHNVPITIDTTMDASAKSIARYARAHDVDLVVVPEGDKRFQQTSEQIARQVLRRAHCDSVLVD
jgi:nucleotide-binding universal stress UspA family protein